MMSISITIGLILVAAISYYNTENTTKKNLIYSQELVSLVENELSLAAKVKPGYIRTFELPAKINNQDYTIELSGGDIILTYDELNFIGIAPNVTGTVINKGLNTVKNIDGKVYIN